MLKVAALSVAALSVVLFAAGCSSSDSDGADSSEAASTVGTVAHVNVPFCAPGETTVFQCNTTNNKMLSVCAKDVTTPRGYIEYRFGSTNRSEATFAYPASYRDDSEENYGFYTLTFTNGAYKYQVFDYSGQNIDGQGHQGQSGVYVWKGDNLEATVNCASHDPLPFDINTVVSAGVRLDQSDGEGRGRGR